MEDFKDQKKSPLDDKNGGRERPRFSILLDLCHCSNFPYGYQVMRGVQPDASDITELKFRQDMLSKNDVEKVEPVMNKNIVRVFIKKDSLNKQYYKGPVGERWVYVSSSKDAPHFQFTYSKVDDYQQNLDEYFKSQSAGEPVPVARLAILNGLDLS
jgi:cell division protease FtsH